MIPLQRTPRETGQIVCQPSSAMLNPACGPQVQPILSPATFLEPPQYLTAISIQPVLAAPAAFTTGNAAVISPIQVRVNLFFVKAKNLIPCYIVARNGRYPNPCSNTYPEPVAKKTRASAASDRTATGRASNRLGATVNDQIRSVAANCKCVLSFHL